MLIFLNHAVDQEANQGGKILRKHSLLAWGRGREKLLFLFWTNTPKNFIARTMFTAEYLERRYPKEKFCDCDTTT